MRNKHTWVGLAIASMWLAVLFPGVFGPAFEVTSGSGDHVTLPAAVAIAPFAMVASAVVGIVGFWR